MNRRTLRSQLSLQTRVTRNRRYRKLLLETLSTRFCLAIDLNCLSEITPENQSDADASSPGEFSLNEWVDLSVDALNDEVIASVFTLPTMDGFIGGESPESMDWESDDSNLETFPSDSSVEEVLDYLDHWVVASQPAESAESIQDEWILEVSGSDAALPIEFVIFGPVDLPDEALVETLAESSQQSSLHPLLDQVEVDALSESNPPVDNESLPIFDISQSVSSRDVVPEFTNESLDTLAQDTQSTSVRDAASENSVSDSSRDVVTPLVIPGIEYGPHPSRVTELESGVAVVAPMDAVTPEPTRPLDSTIESGTDKQKHDSDCQKYPRRDSASAFPTGVPMAGDGSVEYERELTGESNSGLATTEFGLGDKSIEMAVFSSQDLFLAQNWESESLMMHLQDFTVLAANTEPSESIQFFVEAKESREDDYEPDTVSANSEAFQFFELATDLDPTFESSIARSTLSKIAPDQVSSASNSSRTQVHDGRLDQGKQVQPSAGAPGQVVSRAARIAQNLAQGILASAVAFRLAIRYRGQLASSQKRNEKDEMPPATNAE